MGKPKQVTDPAEIIEYFRQLHRKIVFDGDRPPMLLVVGFGKHDGSGPTNMWEVGGQPWPGQCQFYGKDGNVCGSQGDEIYAMKLPSPIDGALLCIREGFNDKIAEELRNASQYSIRHYQE